MTAGRALRILVVTVVHVPTDARIRQRQIRAMLDAGFAVTYAAPWSAGHGSTAQGLRTIEVPRARGRRRVGALLAARNVLREEAAQHDLVLVHDPELLLVVGAAGRDVPVVWDVHEDLRASLVARPWIPGVLRPVVRWLVGLLERGAERRCHLILAEHSYQQRFRRRHPVVPNAPLVPDDVPLPGTSRVVYLGRVAAARGARELVELAGRLPGPLELVVVGDAEPDVAPLLADAHGRGLLTWLGYVPNDEALTHVMGATAGLSLLHDLPNFRGSMPTKVLEYMGCGVPVVTTPLPLAVDVVSEADAGVVVPFGDVGAVVEAVTALTGDDDRRVALGRRGRAWVLQHHAWSAHAPHFTQLLREWARVPPTRGRSGRTRTRRRSWMSW